MSRRRDVIFDNDGGDVFYYSSETKPEDLLRSRTVPALDAGVDTYVYTTGWGFGIGLHNSKVGSVLTTKRGIAKDNKTGDFLKLGTDCLRITSEYVKKEGGVFLGMRMNDTHDADTITSIWTETNLSRKTPTFGSVKESSTVPTPPWIINPRR